MKSKPFLLFPIIFFLISCWESNGYKGSMEEENKEIVAGIPSTENLLLRSQDSVNDEPEKAFLPIDSAITLHYIMGKFNPAKHPDFVKIAPKYANNNNRLLRKEAYAAFIKMYDAAKKEGIELKIISATRNFNAQKSIWESKWTGKRLQGGKENLAKTTPDPKERALKILKWSSMPGTSRHHWGTDIDLNNLNNSFFEKGTGKKIYDWMTANAASYGFCQPYSPKNTERPNGYNEEKWHWSYLPIAKKLTEQAKLRLKNEDITGFKGAEMASKIGVVENFILGINVACQ